MMSIRSYYLMVAHFAERAQEAIEERRERFGKIVGELLDRPPDPTNSIKLATQLRLRHEKEIKNDTFRLEMYLNQIGTEFGTDDRNIIETLYFEISEALGAIYEDKAVVIVACTILEKLLIDLLISIHASRQTTTPEIAQKIRCDWVERNIDTFKDLTSRPLKTAMLECGDKHFYDAWQDIREARNDFIHTSSFAIERDQAQNALQLAIAAIPLFAALHDISCA